MLVGHKSREEFQVHRLGLVASIVLPVVALFLQSFVPIKFPFFVIFDIPLLITIFFAVTRRTQLTGMVTGCVIGLLQDGLSHQPLGLNGIAKTVIGYAASSLGVKIDVENPASRLLMGSGFYLLHQAIYFVVAKGLIRLPMALPGILHLLIAMVGNGFLAIFLFAFLDRFKKRK